MISELSLVTIKNGSEYRITLLSVNSGFYLDGWEPSTAEPKDGGIWQSSPFVDGKQLALKRYTNIVDTFTVGIQGDSTDDCVFWAQEMRRLLRKASEYWTTNWQDEPVWIEAQGECEGKLRYAVIIDGRLPLDDDPYQMPLTSSRSGEYAMENLTLTLEHTYWTAQKPGEADCVYIRNHNRYPYVMWLSPESAQATQRFYSADAVFDNLPGANFTAEIWVYGDLYFNAGGGYLFWKSGWYAKVDAARTITCYAAHGGGNATLTTANALPVNPQGWTHIAITWTFAAKTFAVWVNGAAFGGVPVAGIGAYSGDAATDLYIASTSAAGTNLLINRTFVGSRMTWTRISNNVRFAAPFTPVAYNKLPDYDANTLCVTNGCYTYAGGNVTWANTFAPFYTNMIYGNAVGTTRLPIPGLLGVEKFLENTTSYFCDFEKVWSVNADREGCGLDYAFWFDSSAGTYGPNVIDNNPSNITPTVPEGANDCFYWGSGVYQGACIPSAVVMEFATGASPWSWPTGAVLEYWNGAWVAVANYVTNGTDGQWTFIFAIICEPASNFAATTVNGYYGYFYRLRFAGGTIGAGAARSIITGPALISAPFVEVDGLTANSTINGDMEAIARISYNTRLTMTNDSMGADRVRKTLLALYSNGERDVNLGGLPGGIAPSTALRDNRFTPYLNISRESTLISTKPRNQPGIQIVATRTLGTYTTVYDVTAPGTWITQVRVTIASTEYITLAIYEYAALSFTGKFRLFGRMRNVLGGAVKGQVTVAAYISSPYNMQIGVAQQVPINPELIDFGFLDLPGVAPGRESEIDLTLVFTALVAGNHDINIHDLILWPIDEWNADVERYPSSTISGYTGAYQIATFGMLDPVLSEKNPRTAIIGSIQLGTPQFSTIPLGYDEILNPVGMVASMSNKSPILQAGIGQKLFALQGFPYSVVSPTNVTYHFNSFHCRAWTFEKREQYESMRGNR